MLAHPQAPGREDSPLCTHLGLELVLQATHIVSVWTNRARSPRPYKLVTKRYSIHSRFCIADRRRLRAFM